MDSGEWRGAILSKCTASQTNPNSRRHASGGGVGSEFPRIFLDIVQETLTAHRCVWHDSQYQAKDSQLNRSSTLAQQPRMPVELSKIFAEVQGVYANPEPGMITTLKLFRDRMGRPNGYQIETSIKRDDVEITLT